MDGDRRPVCFMKCCLTKSMNSKCMVGREGKTVEKESVGSFGNDNQQKAK
ncbi:MAG: hypothetical protein PUH39_03645 [Bacteroidales bacterium]|nr:hypothetical protein [Bacteroidales bacterium]